MQISSLVITLDSRTELQSAVRETLQEKSVFTLGTLVGDRLPVVLEVDSGTDPRDWFDWVRELPGVSHVDVAFVAFDDPQA